MLVGHASLLCPKARLDRLRELTERPGIVRRVSDGVEEEAAVHYKFAPMLDPQYLLTGRYDVANHAELPSNAYRSYVTRHQKIMDPMNSAAMDALGVHLSGELFRQGLATAVESFGYRVGLKQKFSYDVGAECMFLCNEWDTPENQGNTFEWSKQPDDYLDRKLQLSAAYRKDDDDDDDDDESCCEICRDADCYGECVAGDDDEYDDEAAASEASSPIDDEDADDDWWAYAPGEATIDLYRMPVVMVGMEQCTGGALEDLLFARQNSDTPFTEGETDSLVMQILFHLAACQFHVGMVHGDLHLRNILVAPTEEPTLTFQFGGVQYEVPTYGRIYKLIDFGRSSFTVDGRTFVSDAFAPYGDGSGMFNCGAHEDRRKRTVEPSRSFDLGLLSGILYDALTRRRGEGGRSNAPKKAAADTPVLRAIYAMGLMSAPSSPTLITVIDDPKLAAEMAEEKEEEEKEKEKEEEEEEEEDIEAFDPEWSGQHAYFLNNGTMRFKDSDIRANQIVARFVNDAVPADLLRRYLRPETRDWSF